MNERSTNFYNRFSVFYPLADFFLRRQKRLLLSELNNLPHGKLLEVGVGNGSYLKYYKKHHVTGIDTSSAMLEIARKHVAPTIRLIEMDGTEMTFPDMNFDFIVLCHVIAVVNDPEKLLQETYRVLKPGGRLFILNHFTPDNSLKYLDYLLTPLTKLFMFRSVVHIRDFKTLNKFTLKKLLKAGFGSYFKLFIYQKL